ncbi:MAG: hypothetical protein WHS83_07135, partial [Chloroflexus sp.]|uniref:hypothetical protein n=1 Tax=Chloroflexus sp. TaxID=1904827 RepID=UPI0030AC9E7E
MRHAPTPARPRWGRVTPTPARPRWEWEYTLTPSPAPALRERGERRAALRRPDTINGGFVRMFCPFLPPAAFHCPHVALRQTSLHALPVARASSLR